MFVVGNRYSPDMRIFPAILFFFFFSVCHSHAGDVLSWTNREGKNIKAAFLGVEGDQVKLERSDGRRFFYPLAELSLDSQAKVKELQKAGPISHLPALYHNRIGMERRGKALNRHGGDPIWLDATARALEWLAGQQSPDGSFGKKYTAASTGFSLLALLGYGETPESPEYGDIITNAVLFLVEQGKKDGGMITNGVAGSHQCYEHAIATQALVEVLTLTSGTGREIPELDAVVKKALGLIIDGFTKEGGWAYGYSERSEGDLSLSNWQIQALWLAEESGIECSGAKSALGKGTDFILTMQDDKGAFKYRSSNDIGKATLTGGALFSLRNGGKQAETAYSRGFDYLSQAYRNPTPGSVFYAPYFNTLAFFHDEGDQWESYRDTFFPKLVAQQQADGSWPDGGQTREEGGVISTAWAALMLEVFYRYDKDTLSQ